MFLNLNKIKEEKLKTDILIIGCGTTAIYIAEKLKQSNKKIIIVEKGNLHNYQILNDPLYISFFCFS